MAPLSADPKPRAMGVGWGEVRRWAYMKGKDKRRLARSRNRQKWNEAGFQGAR